MIPELPCLITTGTINQMMGANLINWGGKLPVAMDLGSRVYVR
jgi:hypothetical protein